jgi:hypothetical protein
MVPTCDSRGVRRRRNCFLLLHRIDRLQKYGIFPLPDEFGIRQSYSAGRIHSPLRFETACLKWLMYFVLH